MNLTGEESLSGRIGDDDMDNQKFKYQRQNVRQIVVDGDVAKVPLTQGFYATIDAADASLAEGWNWQFWTKLGQRYAARKVRSKGLPRRTIYMHHLFVPSSQGMVIDHINRNGLDNRRSNLRLVSGAENLKNRKSIKNGVYFSQRNRGYVVAITLGSFATKEEAQLAYDETVAKLKKARALGPGQVG